jgi:hypothetical protein
MIGFLLAFAAIGLPYPPPPSTTEPSDVPSGECRIESTLGGDLDVDDGDDVAEGHKMLLVVECGITNETSRTFLVPIDLVDAKRFVNMAEIVFDLEVPDDGVTVH